MAPSSRIKDGGTDIACCGATVSKENADKIMAERQAIIDGKQVYAGPLKDRDGKERVAAGAGPRRRRPVEDGLVR